jgi:hypothetical protein
MEKDSILYVAGFFRLVVGDESTYGIAKWNGNKRPSHK